ncbi:hypothetical protein B7463_g3969, partial [Scytalidium lignicola]
MFRRNAAKAALAPPSKYGRHHLPGFNLPVDYIPQEHTEGSGRNLFSTALSSSDLEGRWSSLNLNTLRELTMIRMMDNITDKPEWDSKVFDNAITTKWKEEALGNDVTESMMKWVIAELQYKTKLFQDEGIVIAYEGGIIKSDIAVTEELKEVLKKAVHPLEDTPEKDYHPGSDQKVLDLVHPSLFPLVYGRTRILRDEIVGVDDCLLHIGHGEIISVSQLAPSPSRSGPWLMQRPYSDKFQWLPCDVEVNGEEGCKITSYINNLHPKKHIELYHVIEAIIDRTIPLWNLSLGPTDKELIGARGRERISYTEVQYEDKSVNENPNGGIDEGSNDGSQNLGDDSNEQSHRTLILPEPGEFAPIEPPEVDLREEAEARGLQVIVKLANIHLTPEKPTYDGGSWHVEGQLNEHICATALYYYDSENITESRLAFRQDSSLDELGISYNQDDHQWLETVYGCHQDGPPVQEVLDVLCKEGRLLTFPNILQHRVHPFQLADSTKPGHRKILALFLVDPRIRVISTAHVPPQQRHWWSEEIYRLNSLKPLPLELQHKVVDDVDFPIHMEEAKALRLELMDERKAFVEDQTEAMMSYTFSLCEH